MAAMNSDERARMFVNIAKSIDNAAESVRVTEGKPGSLELAIEVTKLQLLFLIAASLDELAHR